MNAAHFHLLMNHLPILGPPLAVVLLAYGLARREQLYSRLALALLVFVAVVAIPVYLSGEAAEEILEQSRPVAESVIEAHEEAALVSFLGLELLGIAAATVLWRTRRTGALPNSLATAALVGTMAVSATMAWTAYLGGQIAHPETQGQTVEREARERNH